MEFPVVEVELEEHRWRRRQANTIIIEWPNRPRDWEAWFRFRINSQTSAQRLQREQPKVCTNSKRAEFILRWGDLASFLGILLFSGFHTLPSVLDYWSTEQALGVSIVKQAMTRQRFYDIKRYIHFCDNNNLDSTVRMAKVFLFFIQVRSTFSRIFKFFYSCGRSSRSWIVNLSSSEFLLKNYPSTSRWCHYLVATAVRCTFEANQFDLGTNCGVCALPAVTYSRVALFWSIRQLRTSCSRCGFGVALTREFDLS